jgi:polysaccharide export outer membrane protein
MLTPNTMCRALLCLVALGAVAGCASTREPFELRIQASEFARASAAGNAVANHKPGQAPDDYNLRPGDVIEVLFRFDKTTADLYQLQPGDRIRVRFPTAPEMDVRQVVAPDGRISLPYLAELHAAGDTIAELRARLEWLYKDVLIKPQLYVVLENYGQRVEEFRQAIGSSSQGQAKLVRVREDYGVSVPMVGEMNARGLTIGQLASRMNAKFARINRSIAVDLSLKQTRPPRLYVFGQVNNPGMYALYEPVTLFEALAMSGGARHGTAALNSVVRLHRQGNELIGTRHDLAAALNGEGDGLLGTVEPDDVIFVPRTGLASTSHVMAQIRSVLSFNGVGFSLFYDLSEDDQGFDPGISAGGR